MNSYELSRNWFDFCFANPEKINPNHTAIYMFAIEHCNRLGWKKKFGFPSQMTMDALGIKKHGTYIRYFNDLVSWGFFELIQKSRNQYSSNIISLNNALPKNGRALDKAILTHAVKQTESKGQSNSSIDKPITNKPQTKKFNFKKQFLDAGVDADVLNDWLRVRQNKKATNSKTAFNSIVSQIEKSNLSISEAIKMCAENSWSGFKSSWVKQDDFLFDPSLDPNEFMKKYNMSYDQYMEKRKEFRLKQ